MAGAPGLISSKDIDTTLRACHMGCQRSNSLTQSMHIQHQYNIDFNDVVLDLVPHQEDKGVQTTLK